MPTFDFTASDGKVHTVTGPTALAVYDLTEQQRELVRCPVSEGRPPEEAAKLAIIQSRFTEHCVCPRWRPLSRKRSSWTLLPSELRWLTVSPNHFFRTSK